MKTRNYPILTALLAILAGALHLYGQGTAFTYQGRLLDNGQPANGSYDLTFTAFNASTGGPANGALTNTGVAVSGGLFTTVLDFGGAPDGRLYWLQLGVRTNGGGSFTTVSPRQALTPAPYALFANTASNLVGSLPVAQLSGTVPLAQLPAEVVTNGADLALRNGPNAFTAPNQFSGVVLATNANNVFSGTFTGNGSGLTNLAYANLTGAPAIPSTNGFVTAAITNGLATTNFVLAQGYLNSANGGNAALATNVVAGLSITNAFITNSVFAGDGGGLTNLNFAQLNGALSPPQLPAGAVMDGGSVTALSGNFSGSFSGDGGGLTNLSFTSMTNKISLAQLPAAVLTNGGTFTGNVSGNGAGLTNIPASAVVAAPPGMVLIPAGAFTMGNSIGDSDITDAATNTVNVSAFYMDVNLVTLSQWELYYYWATNHGYGFVNPGAGRAANHPVQTVDWYDCVKWCNARSQQTGKTPVYYTDVGLTAVYTNGEATVYANWTAAGYRLPTEAEWEKAARGGLSGRRFPWGYIINQDLANYYGSTSSFTYDLGPDGYNAVGSVGGTSPGTSPVGSFAANGYGLNDMAGNVFQWCWDWYGTPYAGGADPRGDSSGSYRVFRGGSWISYAIGCRAAYRYDYGIPSIRDYYLGFRSVLPPGQ